MGDAECCARCGQHLDVTVHYCPACGAPHEAGGASRQGQAASPSTLVATATRAATVAGTAAALPWQTVVGDAQVDVEAMARAAALPAVRTAVRRSLRRPGIALAVTTVLDLVVTAASGTGLLATALPKAALGLVAAGLAIWTGDRGGPMRRLTGVVSVVTAVAGAGASAWGLTQVPDGTGWFTMATMVVAAVSALAMAVRTAVDALRGPR